jgi:hypothetical protein
VSLREKACLRTLPNNRKLKKIRQVAFLPKTLKRFATCLAPQQLLFSYINQ